MVTRFHLARLDACMIVQALLHGWIRRNPVLAIGIGPLSAAVFIAFAGQISANWRWLLSTQSRMKPALGVFSHARMRAGLAHKDGQHPMQTGSRLLLQLPRVVKNALRHRTSRHYACGLQSPKSQLFTLSVIL